MRKILLIHILFFTTHFYAQSNTDCFSIEPGQVIEVPENAQVGDTIATIQYCSSGEWKKLEAEFFSTLALKENGQLYTWGINGEGGSWPPITAGADPNLEVHLLYFPHPSLPSPQPFASPAHGHSRHCHRRHPYDPRRGSHADNVPPLRRTTAPV